LDDVDIFVSYAREDEQRVARLVDALTAQGWRVFWDRQIPTGATFLSYIQTRLDAAPVVMVAWSKDSVSSDFVYSEASRANDRKALFPVLLDPVRPPLGLDGVQAADLVGWLAQDAEQTLPESLVSALRRRIARSNHVAKPATVASSAPDAARGVARATDGRRVSKVTIALTAAASILALAVTYFATKDVIQPTRIALEHRKGGQPVATPPHKAEPDPKRITITAKPEPVRQALRGVGKVLKIVDGSTIEVEIDGKSAVIRLSDVEAPALGKGADQPAQPMSQEATASLSELLPVGTEIRLVCVEAVHLASTFCLVVKGTTAINVEQLRRGWGMLPINGLPIRDPDSTAAQADARANKRGIWSQPDPIHPEEWRRKCWGEKACPGTR
jgi:endonuclease YncB( thermonuclease family)